MKKAIIAVMPNIHSENQKPLLLTDYLNCILKEDAVPVVLPYTNSESNIKTITEFCDGFIFANEQDEIENTDHDEIIMENMLIDEAKNQNKPFMFYPQTSSDFPLKIKKFINEMK